MTRNPFRAAFALAVAFAAALPAAAQQPDPTVLAPVPTDYRPALTPWQEPDLRGTWPVDHLNGTPMQRDPAQGNRPFLTDEEFAARAQRIEAAASRYEN